jgi:hypothetical protein
MNSKKIIYILSIPIISLCSIMYINKVRFNKYPELLDELRNNKERNNVIGNIIKR